MWLEELPDDCAADADDQDRGEVHASDEPMEQQTVVHREQVRQHPEGRPAEIHDQPHGKQAEAEQRRAAAAQDGRDRSKSEQDRERRKAAVIDQVAGEEPREDRPGAV